MISFLDIGYMGRLGNQMFQFASTVGISKNLGYEVYFPIENCSNYIGNGPIDIKTGQNMKVKCDLLECFDVHTSYFRPRQEIEISYLYQEDDFKFSPRVYLIPDSTNLHGYFQTEKYFIEHRDLILKAFSFKGSIEDEAKNYLNSFVYPFSQGKSLISIHVRRGDYTLYPDHHPSCSMEYYKEAIDNFSGDEFIFLIFSDDPEWCRGEFSGNQFIIVDSGNPYVDLRIMSGCQHHIIANSSFSWWGAWLNPKEDKKVIAPKRWFGKLISKDTSDVYCSDWIII
jgi:hypothetical protein